MKKFIFMGAICFALTSNVFAGGYLTNTNQSINFLRNPSRDASIGIDGVYFNPAGTAFFNDGFHIQFNWQNVHQKRDALANYGGLYNYNFNNIPENADGSRVFKGRVNVPIQPSLFAMYNVNSWSFQFGFGFIGGGGECEFENGVGSFEALVGSKGLSTLQNAFGGYSLDSYVKGKSYDLGFTFNTAKRLNDKLSISLGVRAIYVTNNYVGHIRNMQYRMLPTNTIIDANINPALSDLELDCDQKGIGIAPIIGVDYKINKFINLATKFEFKTKLRVENDANNNEAFNTLASQTPAFNGYLDGVKTPVDMPALFTIGVEITPIDKLSLNIGYHRYFDVDTKQWTSDRLDDSNELTLGAEYRFNEIFEFSAGFQKTMYEQTDDNVSDMAFNLSSYSYGFGIGVRISPVIKLNVAYFQTIYDDYTKTVPNQSVTTYSRTNKVIGLGVDFSF
ncbi:MAG: hypothetical protein MJ211_09500 [Bacteroidales bacterium]|nr:hypothetical protein [Bacteroidales bacterium]